jgi:hypothetical protein
VLHPPQSLDRRSKISGVQAGAGPFKDSESCLAGSGHMTRGLPSSDHAAESPLHVRRSMNFDPAFLSFNHLNLFHGIHCAVFLLIVTQHSTASGVADACVAVSGSDRRSWPNDAKPERQREALPGDSWGPSATMHLFNWGFTRDGAYLDPMKLGHSGRDGRRPVCGDVMA